MLIDRIDCWHEVGGKMVRVVTERFVCIGVGGS